MQESGYSVYNQWLCDVYNQIVSSNHRSLYCILTKVGVENQGRRK